MPARKPKAGGNARGAASAIDRHTADPYSFQIAHRRLAWAFRTSVVTNICLAFICVSLSATVSALLPLQDTRIALIKADPADDRIFAVEQVSSDTDGLRLALESAARHYVRALLEIDNATQKSRWDHARLYSSADFWNAWLDDHTDRVTDALADGLVRAIEIETSNQLEQRDNEWLVAVDFRQVDRYGADAPDERSLRAYVQMQTNTQRVPAPRRFDNPLGITVLNVTVKHRGPVDAQGETT